MAFHTYSGSKGDYMRRVKIENAIYLIRSMNKGRTHSFNRALAQLNSHYCLRLIEIDLVLLIKTQNDRFKQAVFPSTSEHIFVSSVNHSGSVVYCLLRLKRLK